MENSRSNSKKFVLTGYSIHPSLAFLAPGPINRSVELRLDEDTHEFQWDFFTAPTSSPITVRQEIAKLQLGLEHLLWVAQIFAEYEQTEQYRAGRFANKTCIQSEVGPVLLLVTPYHARRRRKRLRSVNEDNWDTIRCDFFIDLPAESTPDDSGVRYIRFPILVPADSALAFGTALVEYIMGTGLMEMEYDTGAERDTP